MSFLISASNGGCRQLCQPSLASETAKAKLVVVSVLGSHKLPTPLVGQAATQWHLFPSLNARLCKRGCGHELLSCHAVST